MKKRKDFFRHLLQTGAAMLVWFLIWYWCAKKVGSSIFLPTPKQVFDALVTLVKTKEFFGIVLASLIRIVKGFLLAALAGVMLATLSAFCGWFRLLLEPAVKLMKSVPVASFIILVLLWVDSGSLSFVIAFFMVFPVIYINVLQGYSQVDTKNLEMAKVFELSRKKKMQYFYLPKVYPALLSSLRIGIGFAFRAGVAAEIIGRPVNSIGSKVYQAKLYLMTDELFAWTIVVILLSVCTENLLIALLNLLEQKRKTTWKPISLPAASRLQVSENVEKDYTLDLCDVSAVFQGKTVFLPVTFRVSSGEVLCVMGRSGEGKTTLMNLILGLKKPASGKITLFRSGGKSGAGGLTFSGDNGQSEAGGLTFSGNNGQSEKKHKFRPRIRAVFQEDRLLEDLDVLTNLSLVMDGSWTQDDYEEHLREVGLGGTGRKKICELSGGMKRRVALVRAVITAPDVLILDEAMTGLDEEAKQQVIRYIKRHSGGKIVILVTHNRMEAEKMDANIFEMEDKNKW